MANKVLRANAWDTGNDAGVYEAISAIDEGYLYCKILFLSSETGSNISAGYFGDFAGFWRTSGVADSGGIYSVYAYDSIDPMNVDTWAIDWEPSGGSFPEAMVPVPVMDVYQVLELHWNKGVVVEAWVDGTLLWTDAVGGTDQAIRVGFGQLAGGGIVYFDDCRIGTTRGGTEIFADSFESGDTSAWTDTVGDATVVDDPLGPQPIVVPAKFEWRFAVTKLNLRVLSWLDGVATSRRVTYTLNKPAIATGVVPSDSPTVNLVQSDGFRILDEGVRCLLGFRRERLTDPKWVCRFAGIVELLEDNVDENGGVAPYSTFTAYDPKQLLYNRPVRKSGGGLPGPDGVTFTSQRGDQIVETLLERTFAQDGEHYIVTPITAEATDVISRINFQQGLSVGEAFDQLTGDGYCDIVFNALYDPVGNPDKLATINVYQLAGYAGGVTPLTKHKAPLAWDKPRRNIVALNRLKDGTQRANRIQYFSGAGGPSVGVASNFDSVNQYGDYWAEQFFSGASFVATDRLAGEQLSLRAKGVKTYKLSPVPGSLGQINSPLLFLDYYLGTILPIFASGRFRKKIAVGKRVISIPVVIRDDGVETIEALEFGEGEIEVS